MTYWYLFSVLLILSSYNGNVDLGRSKWYYQHDKLLIPVNRFMDHFVSLSKLQLDSINIRAPKNPEKIIHATDDLTVSKNPGHNIHGTFAFCYFQRTNVSWIFHPGFLGTISIQKKGKRTIKVMEKKKWKKIAYNFNRDYGWSLRSDKLF